MAASLVEAMQVVGYVTDAAKKFGHIHYMLNGGIQMDDRQGRRLQLASTYMVTIIEQGVHTPLGWAKEYWELVDSVEGEMSGRIGHD
jgi:hypothetical protein